MKKITGTKEWAAESVNIQIGCENGCKYCYASGMMTRFGKVSPSSWLKPTPRANLAAVLRKKRSSVMFPTSHDTTPGNLENIVQSLIILLDKSEKVLYVSKPRVPCVERICNEVDKLGDKKNKFLFRFTIGSADPSVLTYWEPNAPSFDERIASLKLAHSRKFNTSISCEPMLDDKIADVISAVRPYVTDAIWLGIPNNLMINVAFNCPGDATAKVKAKNLINYWNNNQIETLYNTYKNDPMIKWKDSIKKVIGLARPAKAGMDI